jgi:hypothetical protein
MNIVEILQSFFNIICNKYYTYIAKFFNIICNEYLNRDVKILFFTTILSSSDKKKWFSKSHVGK